MSNYTLLNVIIFSVCLVSMFCLGFIVATSKHEFATGKPELPKEPVTIDGITVKPLGSSHIRCPHCNKEMPASMWECYTPSGLYRYVGDWVLVEQYPEQESNWSFEEWEDAQQGGKDE